MNQTFDLVEHGKLILVLRVPKVRGLEKDYSEFCVLFSVDRSNKVIYQKNNFVISIYPFY